MSNLYERIEEQCKKHGITVTDLSRETGISRASFSDLKMGRKRALAADTLQKLAEYFGVSVDYLLNGGSEQLPTEGGSENATEFGRLFFAAYGETPPAFSEAELRDIATFAKFIKRQDEEDR